MKSKTVTYLSIVFIGYFLSESLPFFNIMGVTPFVFFLGLFYEYFKVKTFLIFLVASVWIILRSIFWLYDIAVTLANIVTNLAFNLTNIAISVPVFPLLILAYFLFVSENLFLIWAIHRGLKKVGIYKRINF